MVDFNKRLSQKKIQKKMDPIEIYETIDRKSDTGPLRPAQERILKEWFSNRKEERDLVVKLHTGEGKTLIGLLILQSMLNSGKGPCIYVCPNKYLVEQVCAEAEKFGISYCKYDTGYIPDEFTSGKKILIVHAHKLFNGLSVFGTTNNYTKAGAIILDDSHSCIDIIKDAFSIRILKNQNEQLYQKILSLFEDDLRDQGEGSLLDIKNGDYDTLMGIPYWSWIEKKTEVLELLSQNREDPHVKFAWHLIKDNIENCTCFIKSDRIELSPYFPNVDAFPTFSRADHRILMSATTQDDSFFIKGLDFSVRAVQRPLIDEQMKWSGEKMIIIPSLIHEELDRNSMVTKIGMKNFQHFGCVSIVSSTKKAEQYKKLGATVANSSTLIDEINKLKNGQFGPTLVINNRYDGIDLPDESCRVLVLDSIPYFETLSDSYEEICRPSSEIVNKKIAQKIEQGLGRGVRGEKDYCFILILGTDLVRFIRSTGTKKYFSVQTRKQIDIGLSIAEMTKEDEENPDNPIDTINTLLRQSVGRDEGWKQYYITEMTDEDYRENPTSLYEKLKIEREIEKSFYSGEVEKACDKLQSYIDDYCSDPLEKGWYLQQLARFYYIYDRKKANDLQVVAFKSNNQLFKPKQGILYKKISYINENRMSRVREFISSYENYEQLQISIDEVLDNLSFGIKADKFENSLKLVGLLLGFISQRPDKEIRKGPDNLWCGDNNNYVMFECKNEVEESRKEINKHEVGQMNNHCAWFESEYVGINNVTRILIIPTRTVSYYGHFTHDVKIMRRGKLRLLKLNIKKFIKELHPYVLSEISDQTLYELLSNSDLNLSDFNNLYVENYRQGSK